MQIFTNLVYFVYRFVTCLFIAKASASHLRGGGLLQPHIRHNTLYIFCKYVRAKQIHWLSFQLLSGTEFEDIKSKDVGRVKRALTNIKAALEQRFAIELYLKFTQSLPLSHLTLLFQIQGSFLHLCRGHLSKEHAIIISQVLSDSKL